MQLLGWCLGGACLHCLHTICVPCKEHTYSALCVRALLCSGCSKPESAAGRLIATARQRWRLLRARACAAVCGKRKRVRAALLRSALVRGRAQAPEGAEEDVFFGREAGSGRLPKVVELLKFKARRGAAHGWGGVAGRAVWQWRIAASLLARRGTVRLSACLRSLCPGRHCELREGPRSHPSQLFMSHPGVWQRV